MHKNYLIQQLGQNAGHGALESGCGPEYVAGVEVLGPGEALDWLLIAST